MTNAEPESKTEYGIDDLASISRVASRTIRFYQSRGALMPPAIRGRVAVYGPRHIERLRLIEQLQDRGLRIDAIRDLVARIDRGEVDLASWLGVEQAMQASWSNDQPRTVTDAELYDLAGTRRPGLLADLVRARLLERRGEVYVLASPALLRLAMTLEGAGVDLPTATEASTIVQRHMARTAKELVELFTRRADEGALGAEGAGPLLEALRPAGLEAVRVMFGREMEAALRKLVESGRLAKLSSRAHRAKGRRR